MLGVKNKHRLLLQIQLALKLTTPPPPSIPVLHGVLQINVLITLAWGRMWENTLSGASLLYEPFPSELATTQQLARLRDAVCSPQTWKPRGFPCVWQGWVTSGGHADHHTSLSSLGKQGCCWGSSCIGTCGWLCWGSNAIWVWRSAPHLNRDSCFVLLWFGALGYAEISMVLDCVCSMSITCTDRDNQEFRLLWQICIVLQQGWFNHLRFLEVLVSLTSMNLNRNPEPSISVG